MKREDQQDEIMSNEHLKCPPAPHHHPPLGKFSNKLSKRTHPVVPILTLSPWFTPGAPGTPLQQAPAGHGTESLPHHPPGSRGG